MTSNQQKLRDIKDKNLDYFSKPFVDGSFEQCLDCRNIGGSIPPLFFLRVSNNCLYSSIFYHVSCVILYQKNKTACGGLKLFNSHELKLSWMDAMCFCGMSTGKSGQMIPKCLDGTCKAMSYPSGDVFKVVLVVFNQVNLTWVL